VIDPAAMQAMAEANGMQLSDAETASWRG